MKIIEGYDQLIFDIYMLLIKDKISLPQSTLHCHNENLKIVCNSSSFSNFI